MVHIKIKVGFCITSVICISIFVGQESVTAPLERRQVRASGNVRRLIVNGLERSYLYYLPQGLDPTKPAPVILAFHGGFSSPEAMAQVWGFHLRAMTDYIVVYPRGYKRSWNGGDCCGPAQKEGINDIAFVEAILDDLAAITVIDSRRVFATGFSNGGKLSYRLACELSNRIAAISAVSTSLGIDNCSPLRSVPILHIHGLADHFVPFAGGQGDLPSTGLHKSVPETISVWLSLDGCTNKEHETFRHGNARCISHSNCAQQAEVTLCTIAGEGHQWPGGRAVFPRFFGPGTQDISATDMSYAFFDNHPMQTSP